jgi:hypothetical protein
MSKGLLAILLLVCSHCLLAQARIYEQYASSVIAYSSQYNTTDYSASQILGSPDRYPQCSGNNVWSASSEDGSRQFIVVGFATPQPVNTVRVYQTRGSGGVDTVYIRNAANGNWQTIYTATAAATNCAEALLEIKIPTTAYNVDAVRIAVNNPAVPEWQEFDAVGIANFDYMTYQWQQYASSVISFSSQYSTNSWSAEKTLGPPDATACSDHSNAWASQSADGQREFLVLRFANPAEVNRVRIFQTYKPGAIDTVYLRNVATGTWNKIFDTTAGEQPCPQRMILEINFTKTTYKVDAMRIALNSPAVPDWNEIDAVELVTNLPGNAKISVQSGNWSNPATWSTNTVPAATDTVIISNEHTVTVDGNFSLKSLYLNIGGALTLNNTANSLTLGPTGGGKEYMQVQGTLNLSGGTLNMNGNIEFQSGSTLNMTGGNIVIDGNNGTVAGSVANGTHLMNLQSGMASVTFSGGTITIIDPQHNATGQAITGNYMFGSGSTIRLGNGSSTTGGNNSNGFGGGAPYPTFGNFIMDATTNTGNRHFSNLDAVLVQGNATITSGELRPLYNFRINESLLNNALITNGGSFRVDNDLTNNANISMNNGSFSVGNDFINNAAGSYNVTGNYYTSVGRNLVNNGSFTSNWLYMASHFNVSSRAQTLGGTGTFNIFGIEPENNHADGVTLLIPLTIQQLYFSNGPGKLFIGNNNLTIQQFTYGTPGNNAYVVINGTGRLIIQNITNTEKIFPVGTTDFTPVSINNGGGHTFSVSLRTGLTNPALNTSVVNREWSINDITGGAVSATLKFQWNAADENAGFDRNNCYVGRYNGAWQAVSPYAAATGTNPYTRTVTNVTGFSPFAVNFTASKCNSSVCVQWTTTNEVNMSHYEVERSKDGNSFEKIATQRALNASDAQYNVSDKAALKGISYYRLKTVDNNGLITYSRIAKMSFDKIYTASIYPNPARDKIFIDGLKHYHTIQIADVTGKLLMNQKVVAGMQSVNIETLKPGSYNITLISDNEVQTLKFVKQ